MDMSLIEGGIIAGAVLLSAVSAMGAGKKPVQLKEEEVIDPTGSIDPGNLGPATETVEEVVVEEVKEPNMIQVGIAKLNIKKNAEGLVEYIHDIPLSLIPHGTVGVVANSIRELCNTGKAKMNRAMAFDLAAKVKALREAGKAVEPEVENDKGKTDINAA